MSLFFDKQPIATAADAVEHYGIKEFNSSTRSTVPLLSLLMHSRAKWPSIARTCVPSVTSRELRLEFTVGPPRGTGNPSHTDVMLRTRRHAFAIEAKWTEPRYPTVSEWIKKGKCAANRVTVMEGWLLLLQPYATRRRKLKDFDDAVYQMVHRAASASAVGRSPCMVYVQFCPLPDGRQPDVAQLRDDLTHLRSLLGDLPNFPFRLVEVQLKWSNQFDQLRILQPGLPSTGDAVRAGLRGGPLFDIATIRTHRIRVRHEQVLGVGAQ